LAIYGSDRLNETIFIFRFNKCLIKGRSEACFITWVFIGPTRYRLQKYLKIIGDFSAIFNGNSIAIIEKRIENAISPNKSRQNRAI